MSGRKNKRGRPRRQSNNGSPSNTNNSPTNVIPSSIKSITTGWRYLRIQLAASGYYLTCVNPSLGRNQQKHMARHPLWQQMLYVYKTLGHLPFALDFDHIVNGFLVKKPPGYLAPISTKLNNFIVAYNIAITDFDENILLTDPSLAPQTKDAVVRLRDADRYNQIKMNLIQRKVHVFSQYP